MSGLYLHIPFCRQACHYCNFHFSTSLKYKEEMIAAIAKEIRLRKEYLPDEPLESVYFGGGTPSLLSSIDLDVLFKAITDSFEIKAGAEITLEANPDDISPLRLREWHYSPINRLSIGIQSFVETDLRYMNRAHSAEEAERCIHMAQMVGFSNLTVDLIYGTPGLSDDNWKANVFKVIDAGVPHISCYALTVEPKTALAHQVKAGTSPPVDEEQAARQFELLMQWLTDAGYLHYEISNFALPAKMAVHNSNYWRSQPYLGVGPSAHSFNGSSRQWNVANNAAYMKVLQSPPSASDFSGTLYEEEQLSAADRYNEYVMTGLRTSWGVELNKIDEPFRSHFLTKTYHYIDDELITKNGENYFLTPQGRLLADRIASDIFY
ncbi:MAG: radical SAM family heme chaperone HemW [Bacteroidota bacterium]